MICVCEYNSETDFSETCQSGYVDLYELLAHGVLPGDINITPESFNDIDDPRSIYGKPSDQFEAMSMAKELNERGAKAQKIADDRAAAAAAKV